MDIVWISVASIIGLGLVVAILSLLNHKSGEPEQPIVVSDGDCTTCNGDDAKCEQACMMEAATRAIEYFDDEELDDFRQRDADNYTPSEIEQFAEVLYSLRPNEVKAWNRSLILRGINIPNELKDELLALMEQ